MRKTFIFLLSFLGAIYAHAQERVVRIFNESQGLVILQNPKETPVGVYQYLPANEGCSFTIPTTQDLNLQFIYAKEEDSQTTCIFTVNVTDGQVVSSADSSGQINCLYGASQRGGQSTIEFSIQ